MKLSLKIVPRSKWLLDVFYGKMMTRLRINGVKTENVINERIPTVMLYNKDQAPWARTRLQKLCAFECTACYAMVPGSFSLTDLDGNRFELGRDYDLNEEYGTFMRMADGRIGENQPVLATYQFRSSRLDSIVLTKDGEIVQRQGKPDVAHQYPPKLQRGEKLLANIYFTGQGNELTEDMIYPVTTKRLPVSQSMIQYLPGTMKKLHSDGGSLRILAWGDSVTSATYLPENEHYQNIFHKRLQKRYPNCKIEMRSLGWGGRCTRTFLNEPPGSTFNYQEQVLDWRPDLVISEFVNDCGMPADIVETDYPRILKDFRDRGIEWIILTPHYIKKSWMGLESMKNCDEDPRPCVQFWRKFCKENNVAIADAAAKYGVLWRTGIPYLCYMTNTINHPDLRGMKLFADSLMEAMGES